jgi:transcriptional regulator with XRE-family HTH domain
MTDRFKALLEQLKLTPSEFADRIRVQRSSVSHVLSGRNKPSIDFLEKILIVFPDIDATWLITGRISPVKTTAPAANHVIGENILLTNTISLKPGNKNTPVPSVEEPVDHIIIVYKNNTFRYLNLSDQ